MLTHTVRYRGHDILAVRQDGPGWAVGACSGEVGVYSTEADFGIYSSLQEAVETAKRCVDRSLGSVAERHGVGRPPAVVHDLAWAHVKRALCLRLDQ